jgi:hypothetical protein
LARVIDPRKMVIGPCAHLSAVVAASALVRRFEDALLARTIEDR